MNESTLRTGWVCIATEGKAVDGRDITRDWLTDMAETYDPTYYTAVIWPDHDRWSSYGTVQALKTEEVDGKLKLFAILCPNRDLIYWNQSGQYQFCSIEPFENFADLGRTYLLGLGVTDQPASTGTTHLKFSYSNKGSGHRHQRAAGSLHVQAAQARKGRWPDRQVFQLPGQPRRASRPTYPQPTRG